MSGQPLHATENVIQELEKTASPLPAVYFLCYNRSFETHIWTFKHLRMQGYSKKILIEGKDAV